MNQTEQNLSGWIVGIDGGGSKIAVAARPSGEEPAVPISLDSLRTWNFAGTGSAHPNHWQAAQQHLAEALRAVAAQLQTHGQPLRHVVFALAGAGRLEDRQRVLAWARSLPELRECAALECVGDIEPLIDYRQSERACVSLAVILGTGSIVAARDGHGRIVRAGGWGPNLGDECSGGALGVAALRTVVEWFDTGGDFDKASRLVRETLQELATHSTQRPPGNQSTELMLKDRESLASLLIRTAADRTAAAKLAHVVIRLALDRSDNAALNVLRPNIERLAWQIEQVLRRTRLDSSLEHLQEFEILFGGGLAVHHPALQLAITAACQARGLPTVRTIVVDPILAVLRFAALRARTLGTAALPGDGR